MSEFKYACPVCGQHMMCDSLQAGTVMECPTCFQKITAPQASASEDQKYILTGTKVGERPVPKVLGGDLNPVRARKNSWWVASLILVLAVVAAGAGACFWGWKVFRPLHWESGDVGGVSVTGAFGQTNGVMTITGDGADIWNRADAFHYVYLAMKGDVTLTVRVMDIQNTDPWAKAGLMIRQSLDPGSAYAMVLVTSDQGVAFQQRATAGRQAVTVKVIPGLHAPYWLRLTREGGTVTAAASEDGTDWTPTNAVTIAMNDPVYAGLAVTSHHSGVLCRATFDHLTVTGVTVKTSAAQGASPTPSTTTGNDANSTLNLAAAAGPNSPAVGRRSRGGATKF
jgi:regulation of enolase protein 1 (concanavalin A-like superfamily)/DNA-directed RNA polymerase subunit RPC12/RpoP